MYFQEEQCFKRECVEFVCVSAPAQMCGCQSCAVFGRDQLTSGPCLNTFTPRGSDARRYFNDSETMKMTGQ